MAILAASSRTRVELAAGEAMGAADPPVEKISSRKARTLSMIGIRISRLSGDLAAIIML